MRISVPVRLTLRTFALAYLTLLVVLPVGAVLFRAFEPGIETFVASVRTPAAIAALNLTLLLLAIVVPLNVVLGTLAALCLVRGRFRGKAVLQVLLDLPFAVSPVVVGVALIALWGASGWFGALAGAGGGVIFALPGMVLATAFVTLPFVARELEPMLRELGDEQEQAAATLGASGWQAFWRITLPSIRLGLIYGTLLTISRGLGEYGAVLLVSSNLPGVSQTLTLLVHARFLDAANAYGAYAVATMLMGLSLLTLLAAALFERSRRHA
ncbi:MAG: sulfate ABC transporter permease subunit [Propionicimonas sp.]